MQGVLLKKKKCMIKKIIRVVFCGARKKTFTDVMGSLGLCLNKNLEKCLI